MAPARSHPPTPPPPRRAPWHPGRGRRAGDRLTARPRRAIESSSGSRARGHRSARRAVPARTAGYAADAAEVVFEPLGRPLSQPPGTSFATASSLSGLGRNVMAPGTSMMSGCRPVVSRRAQRGQHQDRQAVDPSQEKGQESQRRRVAPVQVIDDQCEGRSRARVAISQYSHAACRSRPRAKAARPGAASGVRNRGRASAAESGEQRVALDSGAREQHGLDQLAHETERKPPARARLPGR